MECLIGIVGKDFVIMASDIVAAHSIVTMKNDEDKMIKMNEHLLMSMVGEHGDRIQFSEFIAKNIQLYRIQHGYNLSTRAAANFTRHNLAKALRSQNSYKVNSLIGGFDKQTGASLYYLDYLGTLVDIPYGAHGYGAYFVYSIFDRLYKPDMSQEEVIKILQICVNELKLRFILDLEGFRVKVIDSTGIKTLPIIRAKTDQ